MPGLTKLDLSILHDLSHGPPKSCCGIAKALANGSKDQAGLSGTVRYRLRKLSDQGLVVRSVNGEREYWGLTERVTFGRSHLSVRTAAGKEVVVDYGHTLVVQFSDGRYEVIELLTGG